ncbi:hypothetical protein ONZ45_g19642 [Pleurotus djamor]|nr:hypothetical protein ONZ45_g19642 [Pleurotus djamor]
MIFFTTHSTPEGRLHFSPGNPSLDILPRSNDADKVLDSALPDEFLSAVSKLEHATLFYVVCSGFEGRKDAFKWLRARVINSTFKEIIAFSGSLQPYFAAPLASALLRGVHVEKDKAANCMLTALEGTERLKAIEVVLLEKEDRKNRTEGLFLRRYFWAEADKAPHGARKPAYCPRCRALRTISTSVDRERHTVKFICDSKLGPFNEETAKRFPAKKGANSDKCNYVEIHKVNIRKDKGRGTTHGEWYQETMV